MLSGHMVFPSLVIAFLRRLQIALADNRVDLSRKALDEIEEMGWLESDVLLALADLRATDFERLEDSRVIAGALI